MSVENIVAFGILCTATVGIAFMEALVLAGFVFLAGCITITELR